MAVSQDEEIQANAAKIVRICLRDDLNYDRITRENTGLGNLLLKNCATFTYSEVVLNELLAALKNFSKSAPKTAFIVSRGERPGGAADEARNRGKNDRPCLEQILFKAAALNKHFVQGTLP